MNRQEFTNQLYGLYASDWSEYGFTNHRAYIVIMAEYDLMTDALASTRAALADITTAADVARVAIGVQAKKIASLEAQLKMAQSDDDERHGTCAVCGEAFSAREWEDRHEDYAERDGMTVYHDDCCPGCSADEPVGGEL